MKIQFSKTKILLPLLILAIFALSEALAYFIIKDRHDTQVKEYLDNLKIQWDEEYNSIIKSYKIAAEVKAQNIIADGQLKNILKLSNETNETSKAHELLLRKFASNYSSNTTLSLRIFQIHNGLGNVLVRFQKPEAYGDNVMSFRKLLRDAHKNLTSVYGFELGKYFNAYRYAFPVVDSGKLLGSIEIGIDEQQIYHTLFDSFGISAYLSLESGSKTSPRDAKEVEKIFNTKPIGLQEAIANRQNFCFFATVENENYAVSVEPYFDYSKKYIGYMVFYSKDITIPIIKKEFYYSFLFISIAIALWAILTYMLLRILRAKQQKDEALKVNELLKTQANKLEVSEEKFRQMFENMRSGVAVYEAVEDGRNFVFKNINSSVERIEKIEKERIINKRLTEVFPSVVEFGFLDALAEVYRSGKSKNFPLSFYKDDRISGWRENFIYKLSTGEIVVIYDDVTESKKAERALKESEERLKLAVRSGGIGIWEWNVESNVLIWDDAMFALYGAKREDFSGAYDAWALRVHRDDVEYASQAIQDELAGIKPYDIEFRVVHPDGAIHFIKANADTIRDEDGKALRLIGTNWDITKEKEAESILKAFNAQLEQKVEEETEQRLEKERLLIQQSKMAMMGEMIGAIAHQWRQPLTSLAISVQDAEMAYRCGEVTEEYMHDFKSNSMNTIQKMSKTIDDFRDFFKPSKTKMKFLLEDSVNDTLNIMLPQLKNKSITINFDKSGEHEAYGYKNELEQVILICISNAKDALIDNNIKEPKINIAIQNSADNKAILSIEDNGGGVPLEIIGRIFEPYFTTKEQGKGTGIGLYMAKEIIERQMHGKIDVENSEIGAKFMITLDAAELN